MGGKKGQEGGPFNGSLERGEGKGVGAGGREGLTAFVFSKEEGEGEETY